MMTNGIVVYVLAARFNKITDWHFLDKMQQAPASLKLKSTP
jgi:hypothetical protein